MLKSLPTPPPYYGIRKGSLGRWFGHEGGALVNKISALTKQTPESSLASSTMWIRVRRQPSMKQEVNPSRHGLCWHLDLGLSTSRTRRNNFLLFINHPIYGLFFLKKLLRIERWQKQSFFWLHWVFTVVQRLLLLQKKGFQLQCTGFCCGTQAVEITGSVVSQKYVGTYFPDQR